MKLKSWMLLFVSAGSIFGLICIIHFDLIIRMEISAALTQSQSISKSEPLEDVDVHKPITIGLIVRVCNDLHFALKLIHNIQSVHQSEIPITVFWLDSGHATFDIFMDEINRLELGVFPGHKIQFIKLRLFPFQVPLKFTKPRAALSAQAASWFGVAWNKLSLWNHTQFSTILYLDNDMLITSPITELFLLNSNGFTHHADKKGFNEHLNGGVMLMQPDVNTVAQFMEFAQSNIDNGTVFKVSEQSFVESFVERSSHWSNSTVWLSSVYNSFPVYCNLLSSEDFDDDLVKIWHFTAGPKPWRFVKAAGDSNHVALMQERMDNNNKFKKFKELNNTEQKM